MFSCSSSCLPSDRTTDTVKVNLPVEAAVPGSRATTVVHQPAQGSAQPGEAANRRRQDLDNERPRQEQEKAQKEKAQKEKAEAEAETERKRRCEEAQRQEAERQEAERREAEQQEAERREAERREAERLETERREAERFEAEREEAARLAELDRLAREQERKAHVAQFLKKNGFSSISAAKKSFFKATYPLHVAAGQGDGRMVDLLLREGADPGQRDSGGKTAAQVAQRKDRKGSHSAVLRTLGGA